ncbi:MAG: aminotransferase class IV [Candidatus Sericytochromatia bacterium]|nr:aminotransferase class IV [Candidatus Sericytochromatia bacterium]
MASFVYLNGACISADQPAIAPHDRGFLLGEGAYETMRVAAGRTLALSRHLGRLNRTLIRLGIPLTLAEPDLNEAIAMLLKANGHEDARLRLTVSRGERDDRPTLLISAMPYAAPPEAAYAVGVAAVTVADVPHPRLPWKTTSHLAYDLVGRQAQTVGAYEGLFLEGDTWIEGSRTNLIARIGDDLLVGDSPFALPGISREALIAGAAAQGFTVRSVAVCPIDIAGYDGLYLTNALIEVLPVRSVDGQPVANKGAALVRLRNAYRQTVGLPLLTVS